MMRALAFALAFAAAPVAAQPVAVPISVPVRADGPAIAGAAGLFERDWVLANWALKQFDGDRDILLSPSEAAAAAEAFRRIADADGDGRVTPQEYRDARAFILARY